jgi:hypothetical protein
VRFFSSLLLFAGLPPPRRWRRPRGSAAERRGNVRTGADIAGAEEGIEATWDHGTRALLERLGIGPGLRCLEVGAGGGSIAAWMADQAGDGGHVLATDIDTTHLEPLADGTLHSAARCCGAWRTRACRRPARRGAWRTALLYMPWGRRPG